MYRITTIGIILACLAAAFLQVTAFEYINMLGVKPDLLFMLAIFFSLYGKREDAVKACLIAGFLKDITSASLLGSYTFSFLIIGLFLNHNQLNFFVEKPHIQLLVGFCSCIASSIFALGFLGLSNKAFYFNATLALVIIKEAFYTAFLLPALFFIFLRKRYA